MLADLGVRVVVADLDPQAHLTSRFLTDEQIAGLWISGVAEESIFGALQSAGGIHVQYVGNRLGLVAGDLALNQLEEKLAQDWRQCLDADQERREQAFHRLTALRRVLDEATRSQDAQIVLVDVGSNLGAISRAAYVNSDKIIVPLGADLFSLRGLPGLGGVCDEWTREWFKIKHINQTVDGFAVPLGYVVMPHVARPGGFLGTQGAMRNQLHDAYIRHVLGGFPPLDDELPGPRHYPGLMQLSQAARKPIFHLTAADGAIGSHAVAVRDSYEDFERLAREIARRCDIELPD
jgi:chromosome partitioning protein